MKKNREDKTGLPVVFIIIATLFFFSVPVVFPSLAFASGSVKKISVRRGDAAHMRAAQSIAGFFAEVVSDDESMRRGLSGRETMADERGMLFSPNGKEYAFWMKGMRFPLDMVFFGRDGRIIDIYRRLQPCKDCRVIKMPEKAFYNLEINGGLADRYGIMIGDIVVIEDDK